ncbi:MAG: hypothetical protein NC097_08395 [Clostridium sp.]|nr:hypothetical protein [Clostridium sp.]
MPGDHNNDIDSLIQKFRSVISGKSEASRLNYGKAVKCFETFAGTYTYSSDFPSQQFLADWLLNMRMRGISPKTATHYLDIVSALYRETVKDPNPENLNIFRQFKVQAKQTTSSKKNCPIDNRLFYKLLAIINSPSVNYQLSADILLYSLLNRACPLAEVAKVKVKEIENPSDTISEIVNRNSDANRKYLFPLDQSKLTAKQLTGNVERKIQTLFAVNNLPVIESIDNTIRLIWTYAALKCGIPGSEIIAMIGEIADGIPELRLCTPAEISSERQRALTKTINTLFSNNPVHWYAMKLRTRVEFKDVENRIKYLDERTLRPEFFYPLDEIRKRIGKKIIKETQPVIKDIVFFKLRVTDIFPLFCKIGDLAWCYTTTGRPGGDYAPIPRSSFNRFQETIGHFTPEYEIAPIGGFEPKEGETVVMINGPLAHYQFEIEKAPARGNVIYQLNMVGSNGFQWRTSAPSAALTAAAR